MFRIRFQFHQIDNIDHPDFQIGQMFTKDGNSGQGFERGHVAAAGHHHVRFRALVAAGPLPDANPFGAMFNRGIHGQPLRRLVFARDHDIDIMPAPQTMIPDRQQAVGVGRKVHTHDRGLLVYHMIDEAGVLMGKAVMSLLPDMGGEQVIQRSNFPPPRQFRA